MKKEKTVKTYQRRTKSGKMVTVKQHTAKYDAAEAAKEMAKKKGAGEEFDVRKNASQMDIDIDEFLSGMKARSKEEREKLKAQMEKQKSSEKKTTSKKTEKKAEPKTKEPKSKDSKSCGDCGFTSAEFKEWYQGTGSAADKKVAKALKAKLGRAGYKKFEDEAIDNYTSRGHLKMFKSLGEMKGEGSKETKSSKVTTEQLKKGANKYGFTKADWRSYQEDGDNDAVNSRVEKGLKKYLGAKAYKQYGEYQDRSINGEGVSLEKSYRASMRLLDRFKQGEGDKVMSELSKAYEKHNAKTMRSSRDYMEGNKRNPKFKEIRGQIEKADIPDSAKKRLLNSIDRPYSVVSPATMRRRLEKELSKTEKSKPTKSGGNKVKGASKSKVSNKDFSTTSKQVSYVRSLIKELPEADRKELNSFARKASMGQISTDSLWKKYTMKKYPKGSKLRGSYAPWDKRAVSDMRNSE